MKRKTTFLTKALTLLFVMFFTLTGARAEQLSLNVHLDDANTTSQYVPAYWYYFDEFARSQFIIPATDLSTMSGATVTEMRFYTSSTTTYTSPTCKVYVKEVNSTNFGNNSNSNSNNVSFQGTAEEDCVYEGTLKILDSGNNYGYVTIVFDTPYTYKGGNLLVSIENTEEGTYHRISFYGQSSNSGNYTAVYGYTSDNLSSLTSGTAERFIPATTFYYSFPAPTNVTASNIEPTSATISWNGTTESYNLRYWEGFYESFNNGLNGWTIHTNGGNMEGHEGWFLFNGMAAAYSWNPNTYVAIDADNWLISPAVELGGTLEFDVYTVSNYPDSYAVLLSTTGTDTGNFTTTLQAMATATSGHVTIDLSAYEGQTGYIAFHHVSNDCWYLDIDNFSICKSDKVTKNGISSPCILEGLDPETSYGVQVQAIYAGGSSDVWDWAGTNFSTPAYEITLENSADNTSLIESYNGKTCNVTLADRTFSMGKWYTLCLPFDLTIAGSVLDGADARELDKQNTRIEGKTLKLGFTPVTELKAGTPYIIRWESGSTIANPVFKNVTISSEKHDAVCNLGGGKSIMFTGSYAYQSYDATDQHVLFINSNKIYYVGEGTTIGAQRAHFLLDGFVYNGTGSNSTGVKEFAITLNDDPTGIDNVNFNDNETIYNVAGQRLQKMQKGINIVNGKKILK